MSVLSDIAASPSIENRPSIASELWIFAARRLSAVAPTESS